MNLQAVNIDITHQGQRLFTPVSFGVAAGEVCALMGASGCGKSSLIAYIAGLLPSGLIGSGEVYLNEKPLHGLATEQRGIGLLFQDDHLFPHLSVAENLGFGLRRGLPKAERQARIAQALSDCGLSGYGKADPATLSGGQRARVAMQRLLLSEPECLLLDEPFGKLDQELRGQFRDYVFGQIQARKLPCLMVTHDIADTEHEAVCEILKL